MNPIWRVILERSTTMLPVSKDRRPFWWRRLHSLTGVLPLGTFFVTHLWINAKAMQGERAFDASVRTLQGIPLVALVEIFGIHLPLVLHASIGVGIAVRSRPNLKHYPHPRNWAVALQRATGLATLAFLVYHLVALRLPVALGRMHPSDLFGVLSDTLSATTAGGVPAAAIAYLIGIAAASYHFAAGLASFCSTWGITVTPRATRLARGIAGALGAGLFLLGASTVVYYATGALPGVGARD